MSNNAATETLPTYTACKIEITGHCSEELRNRCGGKVYLSGYFRNNEVTYCCSITPSVYVDVIEIIPEDFPEGEEEREDLYSTLLEAHTREDSGYWDLPNIRRLQEKNPENFTEVQIDLDPEDDPDAQVRELLQGNPLF